MSIKADILNNLLHKSHESSTHRANGNTSIMAKEFDISETQFVQILRELELEKKISGLYREGDGFFSVIVYKS